RRRRVAEPVDDPLHRGMLADEDGESGEDDAKWDRPQPDAHKGTEVPAVDSESTRQLLAVRADHRYEPAQRGGQRDEERHWVCSIPDDQRGPAADPRAKRVGGVRAERVRHADVRIRGAPVVHGGQRVAPLRPDVWAGGPVELPAPTLAPAA